MIASVGFGLSILNKSMNRGDGNVNLFRQLRDATNVLELPEERFIANFRVSKDVFLMLLGEMEPQMKRNTRSSSVPPIVKVSTFLKFLASGGYQFCVGNESVSYMSKAKVSEVISECLNIVEQHICAKWIRLQKTLGEEDECKQSFFNSAGVPGVVGCIDGSHVRIKSPGQQQQHLYYNRKGYYSINVMVICDHNMVINYVDARHPGANHDAFVWDQSDAHDHFKNNFIRGKRNTWLLGDSGYKLQPYMMTPYRNPSNATERNYNKKHSKTRNVVERCFGVLKNRFRCIIVSRGLHYSPAKATQIINTYCALHNICIFYKNHLLPSDAMFQNENEDLGSFSSGDETAAITIRDEIALNLLN
ncbi:putative nuclease HARBI1 [Musca domestica]|uniref:Nuclease HARBI1 n=1 Tax=Musca domestica TaxID=7370 RepID=A0ABM3V7I7_MUSDO|nr:putative nuclease HARBI1 [Musca domestica]